MKKYFWCLILCFFLCGCNKQTLNVEIYSQISEEDLYIIGINYPTIGYTNFDKEVSSYVKSVEKSFIERYSSHASFDKSELNIDYDYHVVNERYVNLLLKIFINSPELSHPIATVKTYAFDTDKKTFLTFENVISRDTLENKIGLIQVSFLENYKDCLLLDRFKEIVTPEAENYQFFTFTDSDITIYFNPYQITTGNCNVISNTFSFTSLPTILSLSKDSSYQEQVTFLPTSKGLNPKDKVIALTFDDGPSRYTKDILEILEKNEAVATFFVLGNKVENYQDVLRTALSLGNELGNHTYNHKSMNQLSGTKLKQQIEETQELIFSVTGYTPQFFRPTYGTLTKAGRQEITLKIAMWTIDTKDWKSNKTPEIITEETLRKVKDGSVILMHDTRSKTIETINLLVPKLKSEGYQFVTLSELEVILELRKELGLSLF